MAAPFFPSFTFLYDSHCNLFRAMGGSRAIGRRSWARFDWQRESGQLPPRTPSHKSSAMERAHFLKRYRCLQGTKSPLWGILFGEEGLGGFRTVCQGQPHCLPLWKVGAKSWERLCALATLCSTDTSSSSRCTRHKHTHTHPTSAEPQTDTHISHPIKTHNTSPRPL